MDKSTGRLGDQLLTRKEASSVEPRLLSVESAGLYLSISPWTVRDLITRGELPAVRIGRRVLLRREDLDSFINTRTVRAETW